MSFHGVDHFDFTRSGEVTRAAEAVVLGGGSELSLDDARWLAEREANSNAMSQATPAESEVNGL